MSKKDVEIKLREAIKLANEGIAGQHELMRSGWLFEETVSMDDSYKTIEEFMSYMKDNVLEKEGKFFGHFQVSADKDFLGVEKQVSMGELIPNDLPYSRMCSYWSNVPMVVKTPSYYGYIDNISVPDLDSSEPPKCDCGTAKTFKNPTLKMHSTWCNLRNKND